MTWKNQMKKIILSQPIDYQVFINNKKFKYYE